MTDDSNSFLGDYIQPLGAVRQALAENFSEEARRSAFRLIHTVKGCALMFGNTPAAAIAVEIEDLLSTGGRVPTEELADLIGSLAASLTAGPQKTQSSVDAKARRERRSGGFFIGLPASVLKRISGFEIESLVSAVGRRAPIVTFECSFPAAEFARGFSAFRAGLPDSLEIIAVLPVPAAPGTTAVSVLAAGGDLPEAVRADATPIAASSNLAGAFGSTLDRFRAHVSELAAAAGKHAALTVVSNTDSLDPRMLRPVFEMLVHLSRNCIAHAIADRGRIDVSILKSPSGIEITVADDGRGIDADAVRGSADRGGVLTDDGSPEPIGLIFEPAISTAAAGGDLAGRGFGLDAVRGTVERLNGKISVKSRKDLGTRFEIFIPGELER